MRKFFLATAALLAFCVFASGSFAAADPAVTLVNPSENEPIVANNFLISVKATQTGKTLRINAYEVQQKSGDEWVLVKTEELEEFDKKKEEETRLVSIMDEGSFESKGAVSFFTHRVEDIAPGVYMIRIDTMNAPGSENDVLYSKEYRILVKEKTEEESKVFESQKSGPSQFLQSLLSKIFK
jgi:predicted phage tail protein